MLVVVSVVAVVVLVAVLGYILVGDRPHKGQLRHMVCLPRSYLPRMAAWNAARTTNSDSALRLCPDISK